MQYVRIRFLLLPLILFAGSSLQFLHAQGWVLDHPGLSSDVITCVGFSDSLTGIAVGYTTPAPPHALIFHTTDAGASWSRSFAGFDDVLASASFITPWNWVIAGSTVTHLTHDAGATWTTAPLGAVMSLSSIAFTDSLHGVVVGTAYVNYPYVGVFLAYTSDGGVTWGGRGCGGPGRVDLPLYAVAFADSARGVAAGFTGEIWRTSDGGNSWTGITGSDVSHSGLAFNRSGVGIMVGGSLLRSTDWGVTWSTIPGLQGNYYAAAFGDSAHVTMAGFEWIARSADAGATWTESATDVNISGLGARGANGAWAVGGGGMILRHVGPEYVPPLPQIAFPPDTASAVPLAGTSHGTLGTPVRWRYYPFTTFNTGPVLGNQPQLNVTWSDDPGFNPATGSVFTVTRPFGNFQDTSFTPYQLWPSTTYYWKIE